jgi:hypothetical protein
MSFRLLFTKEGNSNFESLANNSSKKKQFKAVKKALGYLEKNPKHPSLNTHEYKSLSSEFGIKIFEAYAENRTPGAHRIFWHYGPLKLEITIIAITPHP